MYNSEAGIVMYFEQQLAANSGNLRLSTEELLSIRKRFLTFLENDLQSFSFLGLWYWEFCYPQCTPLLYQEKILMIINRNNIRDKDVTLPFILKFLDKILKTLNRNKTLWNMLHQLLIRSPETEKEELWNSLDVRFITEMVYKLDTLLGPDTKKEGIIYKDIRTLLFRIHENYGRYKKKISFKLSNFKFDAETNTPIYTVNDDELASFLSDEKPLNLNIRQSRNNRTHITRN